MIQIATLGTHGNRRETVNKRSLRNVTCSHESALHTIDDMRFDYLAHPAERNNCQYLSGLTILLKLYWAPKHMLRHSSGRKTANNFLNNLIFKNSQV
jgi:hypothetical protein